MQSMRPSTRPPGPRGVAQIQPLRQIFRDPSSALDQLRSTYGPVAGLGFGPARMVVVGDPALLRELLSMPTERFRWGHKFNVLGFVVGPGSMIVSDGEDHHRRRSSVQTAFSRKRLNGWIPMIVERTDHAADDVITAAAGESAPVNLTPTLRLLVLTVAVHAFFGERLAGRADEIARLFERPQAYLESPAIKQFPHPFPFTARSRVRADRRALDAIIDAEIAQRRNEPHHDPGDLLAALVHDGTLSDAEIRDQVVTLIGAGYDTTAAALAWMLWRSTTTPDIWSRLRNEADSVFGPLDPTASADLARPDHTTLARLVEADRVVRESLRLHPPGVISPREAAIDIQLGGHTIRRGTLILWSAYLAGRDPTAWPNPLVFAPDRFRDLTPEQRTLTDQAWVPFGRGARNCIGFVLAQMELTLIISRLAQRLDLTPPTSEIPPPVGMVINRPSGGTPFAVTARTTT